MTTPPPADPGPAFSELVDVFWEFTEPPGGLPNEPPGPAATVAADPKPAPAGP